MRLKSIPPRFPLKTARRIAQQHYGMELAVAKELGSYIDQNFYLEDKAGRAYVLKIHDGAERRAVLDLQNQALRYLARRMPDIRVPRIFLSRSGEEIVRIKDGAGNRHFVRLLSYLPGALLKDVHPLSPGLLQELGRVLGRMDQHLASFDHPAEHRPDLPWDLRNAPAVASLTRYIESPRRRRLADYFFLQFDTVVAPALPGLRQSVIHNDAHRYSVLADRGETGTWRITGLIDFGDMVRTHTVFEVAVAAYDIMAAAEDPLAATAALVRGYHAENPLQEEEVTLLYHLIAARLSMYGAIAAYTRQRDPANAHAHMKEEAVWALLEKLIAITPLAAEEIFRQACGMESKRPAYRAQRERITAVRQRHAPWSAYTHYRQPIRLIQGGLHYLYDDEGRAYLDFVNNVSQWGHNHPRIVRAVQRQMARLNTNSRYLYDGFAEYIERLTGLFPEPLDVVYLVNSGSEANDLALRLAKAFTGQEDVIVLDKAYHGNSTAAMGISPQRVDRPRGPGLPPNVHQVPTPDLYRGPIRRGTPDAGKQYARFVGDAVADIQAQSRGVAAFIAESLVGTGGQIVLPEGYLKEAYGLVRAAGGLCIADEVQVGFGRVGSHIWCFQTQDVIPDIVTLGKPMGNGFPMAAVVTRREIADAFDQGPTYFNTFGGNPVACAAGLAVLEVLEEENLLANVQRTGALLRQGLEALQSRHPLIGDVRGLGLYLGAELVADPETLTPAPGAAEEVVERMKAVGILINTCGLDQNVLKIKPPLITGPPEVDRFLTTLDAILSSFPQGQALAPNHP